MKEKTPFALLINDIHVSKDNIHEFDMNWEEAVGICADNGIHQIIVGGDMFQSRAAQTLDVLMAVQDAILTAGENNIELILAEGNHDKVNQEDLRGYNSLFLGYENVNIIGNYIDLTVSDTVDLYVMSYFPENGSFVDRYTDMCSGLDKKKHNILYCHQGIQGGLSAPSDDELPARMFNIFNKTLVGHYHDRKVIPGTNIEYIGASRQHNFGEDEEKGYTILYTDGSYDFVKNRINVRYKTLEVDYEEVDEEMAEEIAKLKSNNYKVKVKVYCPSCVNAMDAKQFLLTDVGVNKVEIIKEEARISGAKKQSNISQKFDKDGIKKEYSDFCNEHDFDNRIGLDYLDKIK